MIVRPVQINQVVTKFFEIRQCSGRAIDELAIGPGKRKTSFQNQIAIARLDSRFLETRIPFCTIIALKNCFDRAGLRSGAEQAICQRARRATTGARQ